MVHLSSLLIVAVIALGSIGVIQAQIQAHANINGDSGIKGQLNLTENSAAGTVKIVGQLTGLKPGKHGFHIHETNNINCELTGDHFNPGKETHGGRDDKVRHVGDLGNIEANGQGVANIDITDSIIRLSAGTNSVIKRNIVITESPGDLGLGGRSNSITTADSGARIACGTIELMTNSGNSLSHTYSLLTLIIVVFFFLNH